MMNGFRNTAHAKWRTLALAFGIALLSVGGVRTIYPSRSQDILMSRLPLDSHLSIPSMPGGLELVAAWELTSKNDSFGGISALSALSNGRFVGIGDAGTLIGFEIPDDRRKHWSRIAPLPNLQGPNMSYKDRDSEGIAYDPVSGQYWVSFEAHHAIRRYATSFARQNGVSRPAAMQDWPKNKGAECLIRLRDGRFLVIAETLDDGTHPALLFSGDPVDQDSVTTPLRFRPPAGYRVTDGVQLPDGRIAILNRAIGFPEGFSAKISLLHSPDISRAKIVSARVIATLASPMLVDNMEGITTTTEGDDTFLWLISDNNFSIFQRTLLMKFRLKPS